MMQSAYLCVILHVQHKKLPFIAVLTWFLILGKIQDGSQDGDHCKWRHRPPAAPPPIKHASSCWDDQSFSTEGKIVSKYCNTSKVIGRGFINPLPPPPSTTVGAWICVCVRRLTLIGTVHLLQLKGMQSSRYVKGVPFVNRRYTKETTFSVRNLGRGLDLGAWPPRIKLCLVPPRVTALQACMHEKFLPILAIEALQTMTLR